MPALVATSPTLELCRSHGVRLEYAGRSALEHSHEELYPRCRATWRGKTYHVDMEANRYRHSSGWSDWRIFAGYRVVELETDAPATGTARAALADACRPLVESWIESDAYRSSRRRAFAYALKEELRDTRYGTQRAREALARFGHELEPEDREKLTRALELTEELNTTFDSVPAAREEV